MTLDGLLYLLIFYSAVELVAAVADWLESRRRQNARKHDHWHRGI